MALGAGMCAFTLPALAEPLATRSTLTDDWFGQGRAMRDVGLDLRTEWSQFYQGLAKGDGPNDWEYGGKLDVLVHLDLWKTGLWPGLSVTAQEVVNYGKDVNGLGGALIPPNAALFFPGAGDMEADASDLMALYLTQSFGDRFSVSLGKFNLTEFARGTPLRGGGGVDTFWNVELATPITGYSPPTIFGVMASLGTDPIDYSLFVFDPRDATNANPDNLFEDGVNVMASATYKTTVAGRPGFYGVKGIYSTKEGVDFESLDQFVLPPEARNFATKDGGWYASASFQQYLVQDPRNPARGWGLFGEIAFSDGNPNTLLWSTYFGVGGSSPFGGRPNDRFGVAFFHYQVSNVLRGELAPIFDLDSEQGVEAFYNFAVTPWFRITADVQFIDPASGDFGDDIFAGVSTALRF
jgi:porin